MANTKNNANEVKKGKKTGTKNNTTTKKNTSKTSSTSKKNEASKNNNVEKQNNKKNTQNNKKELKEEKVVITETPSKNSKKLKEQTIAKARDNIYYADSSNNNELIKLIKIVLIVTAVMIVFYGITLLVTENNNTVNTDATNDTVADIQYDNIMIGTMLKIDGSFYVLIEDEDDLRLSEYQTLLQTIAATDGAPKIFEASLSSGFNSSYLADEHNYESDMSKFKVTGTTLVKISDHKVEEVFDNYESIKSELDELN